MANGPQQPQQPGAGPDEFELLRRRLQQRGATRGEARQRDLNRRFAAAGGLPSGAAFKIRQQAQEAAERQTSEDVQDINVIEAQTRRQEREAQRGREFAREERIGAQEFAGQQAQLGREFQTTERLGAQGFGSEQARLDREFATGQQISAQEFAASERQAGQAFAAAEARLGREFTAGEAALARDFAREEAETGRAFQEIQAQFQREHETSLTNLGIESNENLARLDRDLRKEGLDIQRLVADSNIEQGKVEAQLNTYATFVNSIGPLAEAGFSDHEINDMVGALGIDFPEREISRVIQKRRGRASAVREREREAAAAQFRGSQPVSGRRGRPGRRPGQLN
jgi:hypothetical protein